MPPIKAFGSALSVPAAIHVLVGSLGRRVFDA